MKRIYKTIFCIFFVCTLIVVGPLSAMATSPETNATTEENEQQSVPEFEQQSVETVQSTDNEIELLPEEEGTSGEANASEADKSEEADASEEDKSEDDEIDWKEIFSESNAKTGLYYYIQKYQYDCKIIYMEQYIAYLEKQIKAYDQMHTLGDITENVLKSIQAEKVLAEAELQIARNESAYNTLYIEKNSLDYNDYNMKEFKDVKSIDYYIEKYPDKDYMQMARYVTDYNNAVTQINAKNVEIEVLELDADLAKLLFKEGEISHLDYLEKEIMLAQAQYEIEQQYANMNLAYYNLMEECK